MIKNSFTLLEILLVLTLIAFVLGAGAIQVPKLLSHERFETQAKSIKRKIELAQEIMLDYDMDVELLLKRDPKGLICQVKTQMPLPKRWNRFLHSKPLDEISFVAFNGERVDSLTLVFDGSLGAIPRGNLRLIGKKQDAAFYLPGFPGKIHRGERQDEKTVVPYPQEIFSLN